MKKLKRESKKHMRWWQKMGSLLEIHESTPLIIIN